MWSEVIVGYKVKYASEVLQGTHSDGKQGTEGR